MSQPMLTIEHEAPPKAEVVLNLLPCRVHHTGPVGPVSTYWNPVQTEDATSVAYFRGRKLRGKAVAVPPACQGVVVERKPQEGGEQPLEQKGKAEDARAEAETGVMQVTAYFDKVLVWSHEAVADSASDAYIRGIEEWLQISDRVRGNALVHETSALDWPWTDIDQIHSYPEP